MKVYPTRKQLKKYVLFISAITFCQVTLLAQSEFFIKGQLSDLKSEQHVAYATVALHTRSDSTLTTGTFSNSDGEFSIGQLEKGSYCLVISAIGYEPVNMNIELFSSYNTGTIFLQEKLITLDEIVVVGEKIKAKSEPDKTTYFISKKIYDVSSTGMDLLGHIPGIQTDMMKNISLEGSPNIVILVDGIERERNYISQLNVNQIDKVEIISTPDSRYDADITGVINIILKQDRESGISGHVYAEIPTSRSEIYLFPDYSLNFRLKKLNFYTSYNGELTYLNIIESSIRSFRDPFPNPEIHSTQLIRQKNWSHRFHYGLDYFINEKSQLNFYAFFNPYSRELDGSVEMEIKGDSNTDNRWAAIKEDTDINHSALYSLYFRRILNNQGREVSLDLTYYDFKSENTTNFITKYSSDGNLADRLNTQKPSQNSVSFKIDYTTPFRKNLKFDAGVRYRLQLMQDMQTADFEYAEKIAALYGTVTYNYMRYTLIAGVRGERSATSLINSFNKSIFSLLPTATMNYKVGTKQNIKFSYRKVVNRSTLYDLNPTIYYSDPYTLQSGNPQLKPDFIQNLLLDYSNSAGNNYYSLQLFYKKRSDAINRYTLINETDNFETRTANLGDIRSFGIQTSGSLKLNENIVINPYLKIFSISTTPNNLARQYNIESMNRWAAETGLSAIASFKHDIAASLQYQYNSPVNDIQTRTFSDALYFVSLEKSFKQRFKFGVTFSIPFTKSFTYQGMEIEAEEFYSHSEGNVRLSGFPVWFKFRYQFGSGKSINKIGRISEEIDNKPKKGF